MTIAEYDARCEEKRAEWVDIAIRAAVLAERARNLAGERPDEKAVAA